MTTMEAEDLKARENAFRLITGEGEWHDRALSGLDWKLSTTKDLDSSIWLCRWQTVIHAPVESCIDYNMSTEHRRKWNKLLDEAKSMETNSHEDSVEVPGRGVYKAEGIERIYLSFKSPAFVIWPRDVLLQRRVLVGEQSTMVIGCSVVDERVGEVKGKVRACLKIDVMHFIRDGNDTKVDYFVHFDPCGFIPGFAVNATMRSVGKELQEFKRLAEEGYQNTG